MGYGLKIVNAFVEELKRIFRDPGVTVIFIVATLVYPLIYKGIYWNEQITNVPVAVVDLSNSAQSRAFLHRWNAAPDIQLTHTCTSMAEAEQLLRDQKVHGIIYFPRDFAQQLADPLGQAHISLYCDMSSFLYMKAIYLSCNQVMLESMRNIQIDRYEQMGMDKEFAWALVQDAPYHETALFSPTGGYGSFLIPAVLMLILHQTLFFGICMLGGTAREENLDQYSFSSLVGRACAYFVIYYGLATILLSFLPRLFDIPHIGSIGDILLLIAPAGGHLLLDVRECVHPQQRVRSGTTRILVPHLPVPGRYIVAERDDARGMVVHRLLHSVHLGCARVHPHQFDGGVAGFVLQGIYRPVDLGGRVFCARMRVVLPAEKE